MLTLLVEDADAPVVDGTRVAESLERHYDEFLQFHLFAPSLLRVRAKERSNGALTSPA